MKTIVLIVAVLMLAGCAAKAPMTNAEALDQQVRKERFIRNCKNAGGIWYATGQGRFGGHCDWTPLL